MGTDGQRGKRRRNGQGNWKIIRYADDFVLMVRVTDIMRRRCGRRWRPCSLRWGCGCHRRRPLWSTSTRASTFLGFDIRRMRKRGTQKHYVYTRPSRKAIQSIKDKVAAKTYRSTRHMGLDELLAEPEQVTGGMGELFQARGVQGRVQRGRLPCVGPADALDTRQVQAANHRIGMTELRRRFCDQGWRFACNGVVFTGASSVAVTRYRYRGSTIPTPWTPAPASR